jgi:hypothetical protein
MQTPKSKVTGSGRISGVALLVASAFFMEFLDGTVIATPCRTWRKLLAFPRSI